MEGQDLARGKLASHELTAGFFHIGNRVFKIAFSCVLRLLRTNGCGRALIFAPLSSCLPVSAPTRTRVMLPVPTSIRAGARFRYCTSLTTSNSCCSKAETRRTRAVARSGTNLKLHSERRNAGRCPHRRDQMFIMGNETDVAMLTTYELIEDALHCQYPPKYLMDRPTAPEAKPARHATVMHASISR